MVDSSPVALARADSTLDLMCVEGNGASISVLEEAGARTADLVIAVSNLDETNLVCCLIAKTMGPSTPSHGCGIRTTAGTPPC